MKRIVLPAVFALCTLAPSFAHTNGTRGNSPTILHLESSPYVPVTSISLDLDTANMWVGGEGIEVRATVLPYNATVKSIRSWASNNVEVATIRSLTDTSVVIRPVGAGTATVTVTMENLKKASCHVTVVTTPIPVTGVNFTQASPVSMSVGESITLTATVLPYNATSKLIKWGNADKAMVTLTRATASTCTLTAVGAGTATIGATPHGNGNLYTSCTVTVTDPSLSDIETAAAIIENTPSLHYQTGLTQTLYNTEELVALRLAARINELPGISATGIDSVTAADITFTDFTPAIAGTSSDNTFGTRGSFSFTVHLTKGSAEETTASRYLEITPTYFHERILLAARAATRGVSEWAVAQERAGDSAAVADWLSDSIRTVWENHPDTLAAMAVIEEITFDTLRVATTGENGLFIAKVRIHHGLQQQSSYPRITETVSGTIIRRWIRGDANGNGRVTTADINAIVNHLLGKTPKTFIEQAADFNSNGRITTVDINLIVNYLLRNR